jgi:hypothetical protein
MLCKGSREGAAEQERRRDEGTGESTKEVARAVGGKATGVWVTGGRGKRRRAMEDGCEGKVLRCGTGDRHQHGLQCPKVW